MDTATGFTLASLITQIRETVVGAQHPLAATLHVRHVRLTVLV